MDLKENVKELFKKLVDFSSEKNNFTEKQFIADKLIVCDLEYEKKLDALLVNFVNTPSDILLNKLRHYIASSSQWLTASQILNLTANLVVRKQMSQKKAATLLSNFSFNQRTTLNKEELSVIEIAEYVVEDSSEGFVEVEDDDIFIKNLTKFIRR